MFPDLPELTTPLRGKGEYVQYILETGILKRRLNSGAGRQQKYVMTILGEEHLLQIMTLQEIIAQNLSRPDLLELFSYGFMKDHIGRQGFIVGIFTGQRLIAFRNVYFPGRRDKEWNLGIDIGLPEVQRTNVANFQMVCVHPCFRGNALAARMNRMALRLLRERATHEHICATVSPYNIWNIKILLNSGFRIIRLKTKYGGKIRYIVYQNLYTPLEFDDGSAVYARLDDLDTQKEILHSGRYGVAVVQEKNSDSAVKKEINSCTYVVFKEPSAQHAGHAETEQPRLYENGRTVDTDLWVPEAVFGGRCEIAGDQKIIAGPIRIVGDNINSR